MTLFELADERALLLVFPNTFEYFFIAYEVVRLRRDPAKISARFWLLAAAAICVLIKLPQEYWIHVAQLDTTDVVLERPSAYLMTLIIWLYDYYRPVSDVRLADSPLALHSLHGFVDRVRTRRP